MSARERVTGTVANYVDERTGSARWLKKNLTKVFPDHWSFMLGEIALYSFVILLLSGTFLTFWFDPSMEHVTYEGSYVPLKDVEMSAAYASALNISFDILSQELSSAKNPKIWWNTKGKYISDSVKKLEELQKRINLKFIKHGGFEFEYPEQLMCMRYINENDKVLEIGGNIGRTAHIIHTILNNPSHHIVMECDSETAKELRENLDLNNYNTLQIETAALSKVPLYNVGGNPRPMGHPDVTQDMIPMRTISYKEICQKYNVEFNVLVADCEGSLYYIFGEDPDMLNNIHTIIMENDYYIPEHKILVDNILKSSGFKCVYSEKGVPWASWSCCFDNFYEVWKK
jgi:FkbM family methyltransferase